MITIDAAWIRSNSKTFAQKRVVVLTGAGISVSCGIPDFRSQKGIFNDIKKTLGISGRNLFTYGISVAKETRNIYIKYISKLKNMVDLATPSLTHRFLLSYSEISKGFRLYTQNIDGLEEKAGMAPKNDKSTQLVYLHGNMKELACLYCGARLNFGETERKEYEAGNEITCACCILRNEKRGIESMAGLRKRPVGMMHTTIIHYDQQHPESAFISKMAQNDGCCDLFIVMGTSLRVLGVKKLARYFCRLEGTKGRRILVNLETPPKEFVDLFDFFWNGDCDEFCEIVGECIGINTISSNIQRLSIEGSNSINDCNLNNPIDRSFQHTNSNVCDQNTQAKIHA
ncbi:sirtuin-like protein [Ordospora colligata]|uniref:Sirtuin-like protein n=1 Tax=Ordospora colligata OC4 TaxID=1354746 RepID=A0A0B2UL97_9MICR|nr:sirtuin-like protein [Ordospora colligata OC4]KHN70138.1 sirtuin-like protein [Ordospora colligata OC4]TBU16520.1 sirtuin-like protein [Ordospora colligata]TBU16561.1 sirtuin-like protein [Ordospora colligata]TBU19134.1 sirtuin-like protein [Ordospora colligata]